MPRKAIALLGWTRPSEGEHQPTYRCYMGNHSPEVATEHADAAGLDATEWQTIPLLLNPPALTPVASTLLAELHGQCGYFVPLIHIRPIAGSLPPTFEAAEIINLQSLREAAHTRRGTA